MIWKPGSLSDWLEGTPAMDLGPLNIDLTYTFVYCFEVDIRIRCRETIFVFDLVVQNISKLGTRSKLGESRNTLAMYVKRSTSRVRGEINDSSTLCTAFQKSELSGKP